MNEGNEGLQGQRISSEPNHRWRPTDNRINTFRGQPTTAKSLSSNLEWKNGGTLLFVGISSFLSFLALLRGFKIHQPSARPGARSSWESSKWRFKVEEQTRRPQMDITIFLVFRGGPWRGLSGDNRSGQEAVTIMVLFFLFFTIPTATKTSSHMGLVDSRGRNI